jgi:protease-4
VTFDGVKTAPEADILSSVRPLTTWERGFVQETVDTIYTTFKSRVAAGRKMDMLYVDSIAQGRVWSGTMGVSLGLVDRIGTLQDAVNCAARMAGTNDYRLVEYPEPKSFLDRILGTYKRSAGVKAAVKEEIGEEGFRTWNTLKKVKTMIGTMQTRLPFDLTIE